MAADLEVDRPRLYDWQEQVRQGGLEALRGPGRPRKGSLEGPPLRSAILNEGAAARRRIAELERKIGEQQVDLDFFRQALRHVKARQQASRRAWRAAVFEVIQAMTRVARQLGRSSGCAGWPG